MRLRTVLWKELLLRKSRMISGLLAITLGIAVIVILVDQFTKKFPSFADAVPLLEKEVSRVPGTAVFLASSLDHMPPSLMRLAERGW